MESTVKEHWSNLPQGVVSISVSSRQGVVRPSYLALWYRSRSSEMSSVRPGVVRPIYVASWCRSQSSEMTGARHGVDVPWFIS
ncbi:hypothetical protein CsSME_00005465 [Camellia sinensis var. sinensis]